MKLRAGRARPTDAGESLVELLVSIAIFGIAVLAILGALTMSASSSSLHEGQAKGQNLLRNWAEKVSADAYTVCATPASITGPGPLPSGYTSSVSAVRYWNSSTLTFGTACTAANDSGLQRVTLRVEAPSSLGSFTQSLDVVVRRPCSAASPC
jgi:Tfp pilus assembly protein PilV